MPKKVGGERSIDITDEVVAEIRRLAQEQGVAVDEILKEAKKRLTAKIKRASRKKKT